MKILQYPITLGLIVLFSFTASGEVQSFRDWKAQRVLEAEVNVKKAKRNPHKASQSEDLYRALLRLEMSKELSVNDYFVMYLSNHSEGKKAFNSAVKKLSPNELSSLLWSLKPHPDIVESASGGSGKNSPNSTN